VTPRIGITASLPFAADGSPGPDVLPYVRAVERSGGRAVLFPSDVERLEALLAAVDGVVLSGGSDVALERYGGQPFPEVQPPRLERDAFEFALVPRLCERSIPVLCVCRGLQVVNVALGGTLVEDLPRELGSNYRLHHQQVREDGQERTEIASDHVVSLDVESPLARLLGTRSFATNSMHHQAVRAVAPVLRAVGRTSDGVIEALDAGFAHPFFYAVQWHPEELEHDAVSLKLFGGLVRAAREAALERA